MKKYLLTTEQETLEFAGEFSKQCRPPCLIFLSGELGAGKTTFVRGFLRALGYQAKVKSPSYTMIESYDVAGLSVFHIDLYRLNDAEELEFLGMRDYLAQDAICLIEWPEKAGDFLPKPDVAIQIDFVAAGRELQIDYCNQI